MTSQSLKNRRTIQANTRRWICLNSAVLGASFLLNWVPLSLAGEEPVQTKPAVADDATGKPAADRWKRLKTQYAPAPATRPARIEQPARSDSGPTTIRPSLGATTTLRPISESTAPDIRAISPTPEELAESATKSAADAASKPIAKEPEWAVVEEADPFAESQAQVQEEKQFDGELETKPKAAETEPRQVEQKQPYDDKKDVKSPLDPDPTVRRVTPAAPGEPPRKTTQVRRIADITPIIDFNRDADINQYAEERAKEFNVRFGGDKYEARNFPETVFAWNAPQSKYYPLYFQDPALERYGHTYHPLIQPVVSSARMSGQLVMMPYQMAITPPWELHSPLGWYRPGDVVPKLKYPFPWNTTAAGIQAASTVGFIFLIP